jgi:hypothetical protein
MNAAELREYLRTHLRVQMDTKAFHVDRESGTVTCELFVRLLLLNDTTREWDEIDHDRVVLG